jgi:hypothetical protein
VREVIYGFQTLLCLGCGLGTRTGVDDFEYQLPFRFTGTIDKLTYNLGPEQLWAEEKASRCKNNSRSQRLSNLGDREPAHIYGAVQLLVSR